MDHARPGHFEFVSDFDKVADAQHSAENLQNGYEYADIVVLDAKQGTLCMTLPGNRTLYGTYQSSPPANYRH
jgi:hypothetical protein